MSTRIPITVARGDGIGPKSWRPRCAFRRGQRATLIYEHIDIGEKVYLARQYLRHRTKFVGFVAQTQSLS
jgi:hypothetical protein